MSRKKLLRGVKTENLGDKKEKPVAKKYEYILAISKKTTNYL
jgi:hypothetical protein